jgi:hypothetical protein
MRRISTIFPVFFVRKEGLRGDFIKISSPLVGED